MLPVYVINLDRRPDRWEGMRSNLDRIGVTAERIPAVDARDLSSKVRLGERAPGRINLGSAANMMSHGLAMRSLLASVAPAALILEDDAELSRATASLLRSVDWWPSDARVVRLEGGFAEPKLCGPVAKTTPDGRQVRRVGRWIGGSAAYLIDRNGARIALSAFVNPQLTIDRILFDLRYSRTAHLLRPYQIVPAMARQTGAESDIGPWRIRGRGLRRRSLKQILEALPRKFGIFTSATTGRIGPTDLVFRD